MRNVRVYKCEGNVSFSKTYLEKLSDGKFDVQEVHATMNESTLMELLDAHENEFNFKLYNEFLEAGNDEKAAEYFEMNARCLSIESYDIKTYDFKKNANIKTELER